MDNSKRMYESTIIINAALDDAQIDGVITRIQDTITKNGGSVVALNKWGRKRLAYPINKKTNGFYVNIEFEAPGTLLAVLERSYQFDEMVLRYLTIIIDKRALAAKAAEAAAMPAEVVEPAQTREPLFDASGDQEKSGS